MCALKTNLEVLPLSLRGLRKTDVFPSRSVGRRSASRGEKITHDISLSPTTGSSVCSTDNGVGTNIVVFPIVTMISTVFVVRYACRPRPVNRGNNNVIVFYRVPFIIIYKMCPGHITL